MGHRSGRVNGAAREPQVAAARRLSKAQRVIVRAAVPDSHGDWQVDQERHKPTEKEKENQAHEALRPLDAGAPAKSE